LSKYTITVKDLVRDYSVSVDNGLTDIDTKLDKAREYIFDFNYPVIDEATKKRIEIAILKHYYMREIAFESVGIWKIKLNDRLNLIMPRYNALYNKQDLNLSPYVNGYVNESGNTAGNSSTDVNNEDWQTTSDTPQGILTDLKEGKYSSMAVYTENNDNTNNINSSNYERMQESLNGVTYAEAFRNYFDNIISIDEELVNEFSDLFMVIW
jgi:hypothetical protein